MKKCSAFGFILVAGLCIAQAVLAQDTTYGSNDVYDVVLKAANEGNPSAQVEIGRRFFKKTPPDYAQAVAWYRKAAEKGDATAQNTLGGCYYFGRGAEKNKAEAVKWYRKAADQGNARAQGRLGRCYAEGDGVEKDEKEAVSLYLKAANQGDARAQYYLGECYFDGECGVKMDRVEAVKWFRKSAEQNYESAQCYLALCYECAQGVEKDLEEAVKWYKKAAEQGDSVAQSKCREYNVQWEVAPGDEIKNLNDTQAAELKVKAQAIKGNTFVFKSLYLGMPIDEAVSLIAFYLKYDAEMVKKLRLERYDEGKWFIDEKSGTRITASVDGKVNAFYLPRNPVEKLFDSKDVEVVAFTKTFQSAYSLPSFKFDVAPLEYFSKNAIVGKTQGIQPAATKLGFQDKWTATGNGFVVSVYGNPTVLEEGKLRELVMEGAVETIPSGSLLIRTINVGKFD